MKYKYELESKRFADGKNILKINLPIEIELVAAFLNSINKREKWYLEAIDKVLSGGEEYQEREGEFYELQIKKDFTKITDTFNQGEECIIETQELKELLEIWINESRKFEG